MVGKLLLELWIMGGLLNNSFLIFEIKEVLRNMLYDLMLWNDMFFLVKEKV